MASLKTLDFIVDHLWEHREEYRGEWSEARDFDFPDYGSLPKKISYSLSPEVVDAAQDTLGRINYYKRKRDFRSAFLQTCRDLGERIR